METSDQATVSRAQAGDSDAFHVLVERHSRSLFRLAYRMTGNQQDAEDVVQESFLRAYRALHQFDARAQFGTWLHRIAANCALDLVRGRRRRAEQQEGGEDRTPAALSVVPSAEPAPDRVAFNNEIGGRLAEALAELSGRERTAFVLRHFEGMGIEEIARTLGVQNGAARHSVFRAVQKLRRVLEPLVSEAR